ncbi:programmed cell death protein 10 [Paragonimus westermani]|uniref:Programmed cell death protein 10 n=1 Tax=Paragonimus westermani TaxID=34504 RepID=A0A5J4P1Z4_9TREM|nr:programmed cell death protein 10 [Paragonimus westermani]
MVLDSPLLGHVTGCRSLFATRYLDFLVLMPRCFLFVLAFDFVYWFFLNLVCNIIMAAARWPGYGIVSNQHLTVTTQKQVIFEPTFAKVEKRYPGFSQEFIIGLLQRLGVEKEIDLSETSLRIAGFQEGGINRGSRRPYLAEIEAKAQALKASLSTIPDEITDRRAFIELIKLIASAIKQVLDAVTQVLDTLQHGTQRQALDEQKRSFLHYCRQFSTTLKDYFKDNNQQAVYNSANRLVNQANLTLLVIRQFE